MTTSDRRDDDVDADLAWFEGLAGRGDDSKAGRDGERIRAALNISPDLDRKPEPDWAGVAGRVPGSANVDPRRPAAANESLRPASMPWRWALAAAVALAAALGIWRVTQQEPAEVMRGGGGQAAAVWRTAAPLESAEQLALELRSLGATVLLKQEANSIVIVSIEAPEPVRDAVNQRLASLETALDSVGRLELRVTNR